MPQGSSKVLYCLNFYIALSILYCLKYRCQNIAGTKKREKAKKRGVIMVPLYTGDYHGGTQCNYDYNGRLLIIVQPAKRRAEVCPWVWRAEFFDAFPAVDIALLEKGYVIVYYCLSDMYGCPQAVLEMKRAHDFVVKEFSLCEKADIFGFSRGGLYACNYAIKYPNDVSSLYLDAPVMDIRSWPLCLLPSTEKKKAEFALEARQCLECYGLTEETAQDFNDGPLAHLEELSRLRVLLVAGLADTTVPYEDNGKRLADFMHHRGGDILTLLKPGGEHWPHSVDNPDKACRFIMKA